IAFIQDRSLTAEMRAVAAHALGVIGDARATKALIQLLRDERYFVREQAAFALGQMGDGAVEQIIEMANAAQPATREAAIEALGDIGSKQAVAALLDLVANDLSGARPEAIEALGKIGDASAIAPILAAMRGGSVAVRKRSVAALAHFRDARAIEALVTSLTD